MKRILIVFVVLGFALSGALAWKLYAQKAEQDRPPGSSGVVEGVHVSASSRLSARIKAMHAREGDVVKAGALLAELDCTEADAAVAEAEARVAAAEVQVDLARAAADTTGLQAKAAQRAAAGQKAQIGSIRAQGTYAARQNRRAEKLKAESVMADAAAENADATWKDLESRVAAAGDAAQAALLTAQAADRQARAAPDQVRLAERQMEAARAGLDRAKVAQGECVVVAPRGGTVTVQVRREGEVVLPGSALYEITDLSEPEVTFYVANSDLGAVKPGTRVTALADGFPDAPFDGVVDRVAPDAAFTPRTIQTRSDRDRLVYAVVARLQDPAARLKAGMPVEVTLVE